MSRESELDGEDGVGHAGSLLASDAALIGWLHWRIISGMDATWALPSSVGQWDGTTRVEPDKLQSAD